MVTLEELLRWGEFIIKTAFSHAIHKSGFYRRTGKQKPYVVLFATCHNDLGNTQKEELCSDHTKTDFFFNQNSKHYVLQKNNPEHTISTVKHGGGSIAMGKYFFCKDKEAGHG